VTRGPSRRVPAVIPGLHAQLVGWFLAVAVTIVGAVSVIGYRRASERLFEQVGERLTAVSLLKEAELNAFVHEQGEKLDFAAGLAEMGKALADGGNVERLDEFMLLLDGASHDFVEAFVSTAIGGRVVSSTNWAHVGSFHLDETFFVEGLQGPFQSKVYPSPEDARPALTLARPVRLGGETVGVIAAHLKLDRIDQILADAAVVEGTADAFFVSASNQFVSSERFGRDDFRRGVHTVGVNAAISGVPGFSAYLNHEGVDVIGAYRWIGEFGLGLVVEVPRSEALRPAASLLKEILLYGALATLLMMWAVRMVATRISRPVVAVSEAAATVAEGDFSVSVPLQGAAEIRRLADSFNQMTHRLQEVYGSLRGQVAATTEALSALEESRFLLQSIVDNSTAMIAVVDPEGRLLVANRAFALQFQVDIDDAAGVPIERLVPDDFRGWVHDSRRTVLHEAEVVQGEKVWGEGENAKTFLCSWFPLSTGEARPFGVGLIATDLTESKLAEDERLRFESKIQHAQKLESLGVLAGGIAHDFNNILAAILGHADLARDMVEESEEALHHMEQVVGAAQRGSELTTQMLAYAGRASFRVETLDLNQSLRDMAELFSASLPKKVDVRMELPDEAFTVRADPAQISQVAMNLLTNAAQAIDAPSGEVVVRTELGEGTDGREQVVLTVADTGCGMDTDTKERMFDPFFSTKDDGRGLGMAAVIGILKALDGSIEVESAVGEGTRVSLYLPLEGGSAAGGQAESRDATAGWAGTGTILVVDDEDGVRHFISKVLRSKGFTIVEAADGIEALEAYHSAEVPPRAIILDMSMPRMGGREVLEELRAVDPDLPILFTTGYDPKEAGLALRSEATRFLQKPYRKAQLLSAVHELLAPSLKEG
jgi:PAS domain S-box-containing protein